MLNVRAGVPSSAEPSLPSAAAARIFQQPFEMAAYVVEKQVGTPRVADEKAEEPVAAVDEEAVLAIVEVEPRPGNPLADEIDHLGARQERGMVADRIPGDRLRQARKVTRTVSRSFINESHGVRYDSGCQ